MGRLRVYKALCKDHMAGVFRLKLLPNGQDYVYTQNTSECLRVQSPACNVRSGESGLLTKQHRHVMRVHGDLALSSVYTYMCVCVTIISIINNVP